MIYTTSKLTLAMINLLMSETDDEFSQKMAQDCWHRGLSPIGK